MRRFALIVLGFAACQGSDPNLSQTQQLTVVTSPTSKDFGTLEVGQTSAAAVLSINPAAGDQSDTVTAINADCPDFIVDAPGLPADVYRVCDYGTCTNGVCASILCTTIDYLNYQFTAAFKPTVAGAVSCPVQVVLNGGLSTKTITLSGTGSLPPIDIDVQPTAIAFGDVRLNTTSTPVALTVRNLGGQTLSVSSAGLSSAITFFTVTGPTSQYQIAPGASVSYSVSCQPVLTGQVSDTFVITSNDPSTPTISIPLACNGIDSNLNISPSPISLATTRVGEPVQTSISLDNSGGFLAPIAINSITVSGTDLSLVSAPPPGSYGTTVGEAVVRFAATASGPQTGVLTIQYDQTKTRTAAITARALATTMALSPDGDVDFGPVCANQSKTQSFSLLANNEGAFQLTGLSGSGTLPALAAPFSMTAPNLPASVTGGGATKIMFDVKAAPTTEGVQTSTLELLTDIPGSTPRAINLSVTALPAGVSPSPSAVDFGSVAPMTTTIGQQIHLSNCSSTPAAFSNARIEGADASQFAIVAQPDVSMIGANGEVTWLVVMSAQSVGPKRAEFVVDYDGSTARVPLDGEGLNDNLLPPGSGGGATDEISYYTCSSGPTGSRAWPLAFAIAVVLRRRRRR